MRTREKKKKTSNNDFWLPKQSPAKPVCNTVFLGTQISQTFSRSTKTHI